MAYELTAVIRLRDEFTKNMRRARESTEDFKRTADKLKGLGRSFEDIGQKMTKSVSLPIAGLGALTVKTASDFESAFAGVRKTVEATEEEFSAYRKGILEMSKRMPQAATEIAGVAEAAGQLGIQNDAILSFTETMVNMGVATDMSSENAAMAAARFATITQMNQQNFDRLGSTIVGLGNNFAATESEIVEMGLRLAGAGSTIGMTEADILSFSAALASVGINAEAGGSAMSKLMIDIANQVATNGDKLKDFAKVSGMSIDGFKQAFEKDAAGAITSFIEGLGDVQTAGGNVFGVLEDLGLTEIRLRDALLRSAGAGGELRKALELGSKSWKENMALTTEAEERYQTFASQLQIFWNKLKATAITIGDALIPALIAAIDAAQPFIEKLERAANWFTELEPKMQTMVISIAAIAVALGPFLYGIGMVVRVGSTLISVVRGAALAVNVLTRAMLANPIGLIISGIIALIAGIVLLVKHWDKVSEKISEVWGLFKGFGAYMRDAGKDFIANFWEGAKDMWSGFSNWVGDKVTWLTDKLTFWRRGNKEMSESSGGISVDGSHFSGLWRVPYDGYIARLHKGERVLTAQQADAFDSVTYERASGSTVNNTYNTYSNVSQSSGDVSGRKGGFGGINITVQTLNVRQESDIDAIADVLFSKTKAAWEAGA